MFSGKSFQNKETFGQFPLQVDGFRDIHESLEAMTADGEIEAISMEMAGKSGQEVCYKLILHGFQCSQANVNCDVQKDHLSQVLMWQMEKNCLR